MARGGAAHPRAVPRCRAPVTVAMIQRFLPSRSRGGVGYFTHGLATAMVRRGHDVVVFSQDPAPTDASYMVRIVSSPLHSGSRGSRLLDPLRFPFQVAR